MSSSSSSTDMSWLPSDAEEQLSLGFRIISNAYKTRVQSLDAENRSLKHQVEESKLSITALQKKHSSVEVELIEAHQRGNQLAEENRNLIVVIRKLQKDINRLETLKKAVLSSIHEGDKDDDMDKVHMTPDYMRTAAPLTLSENSAGEAVGDPFQAFSLIEASSRSHNRARMPHQTTPLKLHTRSPKPTPAAKRLDSDSPNEENPKSS